MKTFTIAAMFLAGAALVTKAQVASSPLNQPPSATTPAYAVVACDGNSRVWERTINETNAAGTVIPVKHSYTELGIGMDHLVDGKWVPSKQEIDILPDGSAASTNGQHKVYFPGNIYQGAIDMFTPDGVELQSRPTLLCYVDGTNSVILADLKSSVGELVGSNQLVYPDAFDGLKADLRYTYTSGGLEQDVVLQQQPELPTDLGLNPKTTRIEVLTEFFAAPEPKLEAGVFDQATGIQDVSLGFGSMRMVMGKAFLTTNAAQKALEGATVFKEWLKFQGRTFLVEKLPYTAIAPELSKLPLQAGGASHSNSKRMAMFKPELLQQLPPMRPVQACTNSVLLAKANHDQNPGLVLDYIILGMVSANFTFQADTTYLMNNGYYFQINGLATFEGGTVIKFTSPSAAFVALYGGVVSCLSAPYRPIILTAIDDDTVGEKIPGSTGVPSGSYGSGITIQSPNNVTLHDVRMSYLNSGFIMYSSSSEFDNIQAINCNNPILHAYAGTTINNGLFYNIGGTAVLASGSSTPVAGNQLTIDNCNIFADSNTPALTLVNSLVTGTTNVLLDGTGTLSTNQVIILASNSGVYQPVGAGSHYLANGSPYRAVGTNAIPAGVLAGLSARTTYPPIIYSSQSFTVSTNLLVQPIRDTNASPDLGYHYDALDYITDELGLTNASLTVTNGVAIACYNEPGIALQGSSSVVSIGTPLLPNWFVHYQCVQDQAEFLGGTNTFSGQNIAVVSSGGNPNGIFQFTHFSTPAAGGFVFADNAATPYSNLTIQHSELWGGTNDFSGPSSTASALLLNNLFFRSAISASNSSSSATLAFTNNLIYGTALSLIAPGSGAWYFYNNDVDGCLVDTNSFITNGNNAFINCSTNFTGASNIISTNLIGYQTGPLGIFYQPPTSPLIQAGTAPAASVGLYAFTTQTNETEETNATVDIGYHYVALGTNGLPLITNTNGVPDYILFGGIYGGFDTNGLPYWWELLYFGHTGVDPNADPENDGLTNLQKYQDGLNPNVDQSTVSGTRLNYTYDAGGWLRQVSGIHSGTVSPDNQGNVQQSSQ